MRWIIALFAGGLFGAGLAVSGMADPTRVRAFLDLTGGAWDPTLAFVMGGAIIPMAVAWVVRGRLDAPVAAPEFTVPGTNPITPRLIGGAMLFGIGWGIAGLRSEEHTSELQSLMRISYAGFCLKKKNITMKHKTVCEI